MNTFGRYAIFAVGIAAIIALVYVGLNVLHIAVPAWVVTVFWILVVAAVLMGAIKLVMRMSGTP